MDGSVAQSGHGTGLFNWCIASGNVQTTPYNCSTRNRLPASLCGEGAGLYIPPSVLAMATAASSLTSWNPVTAENEVTNSKGGMLLASTPSVEWRLPTREDFLVAHANGAAMVLPRYLDFRWFTSTSMTDSSGFVWTWLPVSAGNTSLQDVAQSNDGHYVRCVGRLP
jgi:hypothetical protein